MMKRAQAAAIGAGYGPDIFHPSIAAFHPDADADACFSDEDEQSYDEFVEMGNRKPNAEGTGRWKRTLRRRKLGLLMVPTAKPTSKSKVTQSNDTISILRPFLAAYLCMEVDMVPSGDVCWNPKTRTLRIAAFEYHMRMGSPGESSAKKAKRKRTEPSSVDVFSIFDAFEDAKVVKPPYFSILVVTPFNLVEDVDGSFVQVLGRSYPDRVACVALNQSIRSLLVTAAHELLHGMGVDHCSSFACVMNAISSDDNWMLLSPPNLRKLKCFHGIPDADTAFLLHRYTALVRILQTSLAAECADEIDMITQKMAAMHQLGLASSPQPIAELVHCTINKQLDQGGLITHFGLTSNDERVVAGITGSDVASSSTK